MVKIFCAPRCTRDGSAAARSLLELAFNTEVGGVLPDIKKTPNGKPYFPARPEIHFSLSHSRTHVLCGISFKPIGVDIESPRIISDQAAGYFSSPSELFFFEPLDLWVLKESFVKLIGGRLSLLKKLNFSRENGRIITPNEFAISKLYKIGDCRAAVSSFAAGLPESIELASIT